MDGEGGSLTPWTAEDVAKELRISKTTVYELVRIRALKAARIGRQLRFRREWVEEYLSRASGGEVPAP